MRHFGLRHPGVQPSELPSRNAGFVDQGYDWKTIGMTPNYTDRGGCAVDIRAAEVPKDHETKARNPQGGPRV